MHVGHGCLHEELKLTTRGAVFDWCVVKEAGAMEEDLLEQPKKRQKKKQTQVEEEEEEEGAFDEGCLKKGKKRGRGVVEVSQYGK